MTNRAHSRVSAVGAILLLLAGLGLTQGVQLSLIELYTASDLVVIGTLQRTWTWSSDGVDHGVGDIEVVETLWGAASIGDTLRLRWVDPFTCPRHDHQRKSGIPGIWFLSDSGNVRPSVEPWWLRALRMIPFTQPSATRGVYAGPDAFRPLSDKPMVEAIVGTPIFFARGVRKPQTPDSAIRDLTVEFISRNGSKLRQSMPAPEVTTSGLGLPPSITGRLVRFHDGHEELVVPFQRDGEAIVILEPNQEFKTAVNVAELAALEVDSLYGVRISEASAEDSSLTFLSTGPIRDSPEVSTAVRRDSARAWFSDQK